MRQRPFRMGGKKVFVMFEDDAHLTENRIRVLTASAGAVLSDSVVRSLRRSPPQPLAFAPLLALGEHVAIDEREPRHLDAARGQR